MPNIVTSNLLKMNITLPFSIVSILYFMFLSFFLFLSSGIPMKYLEGSYSILYIALFCFGKRKANSHCSARPFTWNPSKCDDNLTGVGHTLTITRTITKFAIKGTFYYVHVLILSFGLQMGRCKVYL